MKRRNLILLLILAALIGGYFLLRSRAPREKLKDVFSADSTSISRIEISQGNQSVVIERSGSNWMITDPVTWDVNRDRFAAFFQDVLRGRYASTPIDSGKEAVSKYQLEDSLALQVKVYEKGNKPKDWVLFANLNNPSDYFRFHGKQAVYIIPAKVASAYQPDLGAWRSPHVISYQPQQLDSIAVKHDKNQYLLTRSGSVWRYQDKSEEFDVPAGNVTMGKIQNLLVRLDSYTVMEEKDKPAEADLTAPVCEVSLGLTDGGKRELKFYKWGNDYLMAVDQHPGVYFLVSFDQVFRFMRHASLFRAIVGLAPPSP